MTNVDELCKTPMYVPCSVDTQTWSHGLFAHCDSSANSFLEWLIKEPQQICEDTDSRELHADKPNSTSPIPSHIIDWNVQSQLESVKVGLTHQDDYNVSDERLLGHITDWERHSRVV